MIELMEIPKSIFRQVGSTGDVQELMDNFFRNAKEYVQTKLEEGCGPFFEIKSATLTYYPGKVDSDNRITYVEFKERYVIAGMLETRTAFNNLQFTFFRDLSFLENLTLL